MLGYEIRQETLKNEQDEKHTLQVVKWDPQPVRTGLLGEK